MGAWIETAEGVRDLIADIVAPFMGAWIETVSIALKNPHKQRRSLHGSVD